MDSLHHILEFPCHIISKKKLRKESLNCAYSLLLKNMDIKYSTYRRYGQICSTARGKYKNCMAMLHIRALTFYNFRSLLTWFVCLCASNNRSMAKVSLVFLSLWQCWLSHLDLLWNVQRGFGHQQNGGNLFFIHQLKTSDLSFHFIVQWGKYFSNLFNQCPFQ